MGAIQSEADARSILGADVLGPEEVATAFGTPAKLLGDLPIPYSRQELQVAMSHGEMLVLRLDRAAADSSLTIQDLIRRYPQAFDARFLRKMGYQLKDEWGIELEPSAAVDTCTTGWALVRKAPIDSSCNLSYDEQEPRLRSYAEELGVAATAVRRRTAVEIAYDTVLYFAARNIRLLEKAWDWSSTRTIDGGYLNVGGFHPNGLQILSYSRAVRHGALGTCPTRQAAR
ncbi:MAG: hypothetical protein HY270_22915 [Deltaproteobacteria bacterium]|nr:hypothetical protein [Deltaproteobacteria bacterium]